MNTNSLLRFFFSFYLLFSLGGNSVAQTTLISPNVIDESGFGYTKVIGQDEEGYFLLMSNLSMNTESDRVGFKNRKYKLAWFNHALEKKWSKPIEAASDAMIEAVTFFNHQVLIVTTSYNRQDKKVKCKFITVDGHGTFTDAPGSAEFSPISENYDKSVVVFSINRQKLAVLVREITTDSSQTVFTAVADTALRIETQKSVVIHFPEKKFGFNSFALSMNGDLAILGYHSEKIKALSSKRKIDYYVYASSATEPGFKEYAIPAQRYISALGLAFDNFNNYMVVAGFYFEKESNAGTGIFYATVDMAKNDELNFNTKIIEGQNSANLKRERSLSSGTGITDYPIERIVIRDDGGAIIVAESAYTTEYSYYDSFSQSFTQRTEFHFENVVVVSVNRDATVDWSAVVEKNQVSLDDDGVFSSFCSMVNSEQFLILYNDDISKHNKITPAVISNKGVLTKEKPVQISEGFIILPRSGKQVSENEMLIPAYKKRELHLVRFTFE